MLDKRSKKQYFPNPHAPHMKTHTGRFTLSKFKFYSRLSQETNCFTADLLLNGHKIALVENRGHGGATTVDLTTIGLNMPELVAQNNLRESDKNSLVSIVDRLADDHVMQAEKDRVTKKIARDLAKTVIFSRKGDKAGAYRTLRMKFATPDETKAAALQLKQTSPNVDKVLNLMPLDEAVSLLVSFE